MLMESKDKNKRTLPFFTFKKKIKPYFLFENHKN